MKFSSLKTLQKAETLVSLKKFSRALPLLKSVEKRAPDVFLKAEAAYKRAEILRELSRFFEALDAYWTSHGFYRRAGVSSERVRTLLGASACLRILNRFSEARRLWARVARMEFFRRAKDPSPEDVSLEIALVERGLGNHARAGVILKKTVEGFKKKDDVEGLRHALWALAGVERFSGNFSSALVLFRRVEALARRLGDDSAEGYALCGQAACLRILGRGEISLQKYKKAHGIFREINDLFGQAYGLCGMANALRVWGDAEKTLSLYRRSAALYKRVGDEGSRAFALWGMGGSLRRIGRLSEAASFYEKALDKFKKVGDERGVVMCFLGFARISGERRNFKDAVLWTGSAAAAAHRADLKYEKALASYLKSNFENNPRFHALKSLGIPLSAIKNWKDIP